MQAVNGRLIIQLEWPNPASHYMKLLVLQSYTIDLHMFSVLVKLQ